MVLNGDKKSKQISLDISPLFSHTAPKLVPALVTTYDEIYQALAAGTSCSTSHFWISALTVPSNGNRQPRDVFFQSARHVEVQGSRVGAVGWVGWGPEMASGTGRHLVPQGLANLIVCYDKYLKNLGTVWDNRGLTSKHTTCFSCLHLTQLTEKDKKIYLLRPLVINFNYRPIVNSFIRVWNEVCSQLF
jgi:hypothetical protein